MSGSHSTVLWRLAAVAVIVVVAGTLVRGTALGPADNNLYVLQTSAWLRGSLAIDVNRGDAAPFKGQYFVPFPPFPSVVYLPFVATGLDRVVRPTVLSGLLTVLNVWLVRKIFAGLAIREDSSRWLTAAFFLGTGYWLAVVNSSGVWFFAHVVGLTFALVAVWLAISDRSMLLAGMCLGCALLSRQLMIGLLPFVAGIYLFKSDETRRPVRMRHAALLCLPVAIALLVYGAYNAARFGNPLETGYGYIYSNPAATFYQARVPAYGLFNIAYVPFNAVYLFLQGPAFRFSGAAQLSGPVADPLGTSLTFASPFLLLAFWSRRRWLAPLGWLSVGTILLPILTYHTNGWVQFNTQRYTLDFLPALAVLAALGADRLDPQWSKWLCAYAIGLNALIMATTPTL